MMMIYSLFYMLGLVFISAILIIYEIRRNDHILLKYWFAGVLFYFFRILLLIAGFILEKENFSLNASFYSISLFLYGFVIASFNTGFNFVVSYENYKRENYIILSYFSVFAIALLLFDLNPFNLLFGTHFVIGLGTLHLAFGAYRLWVEKKIKEAQILSINFGLWGLITPIFLLYLHSNFSLAYLPIIEAIFLTIFISISLFFISTLRRKSDALYLQHYKSIYSLSSDILLLLDKTGGIIQTSGSFKNVFSVNKSDISKIKFHELIAPELYDVCLEKWGKVVLGKQANATLAVNPKYVKNSVPDDLEFTLTPLTSEGILEMVSVIGKNKSSQSGSEGQAPSGSEKRSSDIELEHILSMTSHELRSPMIVVEGYVSALSHALKDVKLPPEVKEYPKFIVKSVKKVSELVQAILDLSKVDSKATSMTAIDLNQVFNRVEGDIVQLHSPSSYDLTIARNMPLVFGNKILLSQLFINLIKNSIKYADKNRKPEIDVGIHSQDDQNVVLSVKDNGIGMAKKDLEKIFSPMMRLHKVDAQGYGLGLAFVKKIAEAHHATIDVESEEGKGSTFFVSLKKFEHN